MVDKTHWNTRAVAYDDRIGHRTLSFSIPGFGA